MAKMRHLFLFVLLGAAYAKPGFLEHAPPTPSAPPAIIANLASPTPSIASIQASAATLGAPIVNIGGQPQGLQFHQIPQNYQADLGLAQPGLSLPQPQISYGPPGLTLPQPQLNYIQPGLNYAQPGLNFGQPIFNFLPIGGAPQLNLAQVGPTVGPLIASTIGPSVQPTITFNSGPTLAPPIGPTIAPVVSSTLAPIGSTIESGPARISINSGASDVEISSGNSLVHKHVYVYVAPEQPEEYIPRKPIHVPPPQTHYRIIFIKAPTPPKPTAAVIPPLPQDEEKTIVYVLARRPEKAPEIKLQTPPPTQPAKPEVYFIRYNAKKEGGDAGYDNRPEVDIDVRGESPSVTVNSNGLGGIAQDLNTASLSGGSALSTAIQVPNANLIQLSTTATPIPKYGPPSYQKK